MTLDQLRIFVAVAEAEHVTRAAAGLGITQSAASAAVAALEGRHGVALFHRLGRGIRLTEEGRIFLAEARAVLARAEAAAAVLHDLGTLERGNLTVQASQTIAGYWLPRHLVALRRRHPGLAVRLTIGNTAQVARAVEDGAADLGFVEGEVDAPALDRHEVARDRLVIVVAPDHPWAVREATHAAPITTADLPQTSWVLREPGSGTRSEFERALAGFGLDPAALTVALELPSNESVRAAVEAGAGATALSASVAAGALEAGLLCAVGPTLPDRAFHLLRHRDRHQSRAAQALTVLVLGE